ncbi:MAG: tyrosine-protein phosphatase [Sulfitobacter sp.]
MAVRKPVFLFARMLLGAVLLLLGYLAYLQASGNFHEVSAGKVYRAGQMDGQALSRWKREQGIASILNLRGSAPGADWYETERIMAASLGIEHIDFKLSASEELDDAQVQALLEVMRNAPKPMLIHCMAGADRTGIASALYVAGVEGRSEEDAEWHLSIAYGHIGIPWLSNAWPMNVTWERIEPFLGYPES